jgi:hypothetical protein
MIETLEPGFDEGPDGFIDTAAVIANLDLVITVDTAAAHLAGALGKPAIVLLKSHNTDWRWLQGRSDTLWYPSLELRRQTTPGDWAGLLQSVAEELRQPLLVSAAQEAVGADPLAPVSLGELLDKITILEIKLARLEDAAKRANVRAELEALQAVDAKLTYDRDALGMLIEALKRCNEALWDIEDAKRGCERAQDFGADFIWLARQVYLLNDERAGFKRQINALGGSRLVEEKSYAPYAPADSTVAAVAAPTSAPKKKRARAR